MCAPKQRRYVLAHKNPEFFKPPLGQKWLEDAAYGNKRPEPEILWILSECRARDNVVLNSEVTTYKLQYETGDYGAMYSTEVVIFHITTPCSRE